MNRLKETIGLKRNMDAKLIKIAVIEVRLLELKATYSYCDDLAIRQIKIDALEAELKKLREGGLGMKESFYYDDFKTNIMRIVDETIQSYFGEDKQKYIGNYSIFLNSFTCELLDAFKLCVKRQKK